MYHNQKRLVLSGTLLLGLSMACSMPAYAAKSVNLSHQKVSILQSLISSPTTSTNSAVQLKETNRSLDFNQTLHVRLQETYKGYAVWGGDMVVHIPKGAKTEKSLNQVLLAAKNNKGSMNGTLFQNIETDLAKTPAIIFNESQAQKALQEGINTYQQKAGTHFKIKNTKSTLIVFIDQANKAHFAYRVSFSVDPAKEGAMPAQPIYIMDALSFSVYKEWNNIQTLDSVDSLGGGDGGNLKMGELVYDGLANDLPKLSIMRDADTQTCYLQNADVKVTHYSTEKVISFACDVPNGDHDNVYWDGETDAVNGGYSPSNDALFGGAVIKDMYQKWYGVPVLTDENGQPMLLHMAVHLRIDNAFWDGQKMTFGDGVRVFYPLTSLGVAAHEISHGFTQQHSGLVYSGQSGGMNEAFSDMAAQGAEFYAYGKNSWQIGPEIFKKEGKALRYMDQPSKDCNGGKPGNWCSIDEVSQYYDGLDVHFSSGIYNRVFYLIGTSPGWDAKKAFDVMVQANAHYWTSNTSFAEGACGVLKATADHGYNVDDVVAAFNVVGVDTSTCNS